MEAVTNQFGRLLLLLPDGEARKEARGKIFMLMLLMLDMDVRST
jgi:hypothetical protein